MSVFKSPEGMIVVAEDAFVAIRTPVGRWTTQNIDSFHSVLDERFIPVVDPIVATELTDEAHAAAVIPLDKFDSDTYYWDVDGIPVTVGAGIGPDAVVAWDVPGGRPFRLESLRGGCRVYRPFFLARLRNFY